MHVYRNIHIITTQIHASDKINNIQIIITNI